MTKRMTISGIDGRADHGPYCKVDALGENCNCGIIPLKPQSSVLAPEGTACTCFIPAGYGNPDCPQHYPKTRPGNCKRCQREIHLSHGMWVHSAAGLVKFDHNAEPERPVTPQAESGPAIVWPLPYWQCPNDESHPLEDRGKSVRRMLLYCTRCPETAAVFKQKAAEPGASEPKLDEDACVHCHHRPHLPTCSLISPVPAQAFAGLSDEEIARKAKEFPRPKYGHGHLWGEEHVVAFAAAAIAEVRQRELTLSRHAYETVQLSRDEWNDIAIANTKRADSLHQERDEWERIALNRGTYGAKVENERDSLAATLEKVRETLVGNEWNSTWSTGEGRIHHAKEMCPICEQHPDDGHTADCWLAAALASLSPAPGTEASTGTDRKHE